MTGTEQWAEATCMADAIAAVLDWYNAEMRDPENPDDVMVESEIESCALVHDEPVRRPPVVSEAERILEYIEQRAEPGCTADDGQYIALSLMIPVDADRKLTLRAAILDMLEAFDDERRANHEGPAE